MIISFVKSYELADVEGENPKFLQGLINLKVTMLDDNTEICLREGSVKR